MQTLINEVFPTLRLYASQILVFMFTYWITCIPFAVFALDRVYRLLKKIR